jgi:hypothetical protein
MEGCDLVVHSAAALPPGAGGCASWPPRSSRRPTSPWSGISSRSFPPS